MPRLPKGMERRGEIYYYRRQVGGKRRRWTLGKYLPEARILKQRIDAEITRGRIPIEDPERETVATFGQRWLEERVRARRKPQGVAMARQRLRDWIEPTLGDLPLDRVRRDELFRLRRHLDESHLSPETVRHVLSDLRNLLYYAEDVEIIPTAPSFRGVLPKRVERPADHLSVQHLAEILRDALPHHAFAVKLAVLTGLRWGELHNLQWHDIHWDQRKLIVRESKSGKFREVPLCPEARALLGDEFRRTSGVFVLPFWGKNPGAWVRRITERIERRHDGKGNWKWRFHQTRHTFSNRWLKGGGSSESLRRILGHSSVKVTERYGHLDFDHLARQMEEFGLEVAPKWPKERAEEG